MTIRSNFRRGILAAALGLGAAAFTVGLAGPAAAATTPDVATAFSVAQAPLPASAHPHGRGAVYLLTNDSSHNAVMIFARGTDGRLSQTDTVGTGGRGGSQVGAVVDPLASQAGLNYDADHRLLYAVNAGSGTLSVLAVEGGDVRLRQTVNTRGYFPSSVAVAGNLVYVLDAGGSGAITGFWVIGERLYPISGSTRLSVANDPVPAFLASPSQIAISPDRQHLIVATKSAGPSSASTSTAWADRPSLLLSPLRRPGCRSG